MKKKINKPKHKNNHARAKQRIKILLMKNFCKRVMDNRGAKIAKLRKPKGNTIRGIAINSIPKVRFSLKYYHKTDRLNQRQKRKLWKQVPHMRKRA